MNCPFRDDALQPFSGGLDGALVDIGGDPAPAQFLGAGSGCARANETIEDNIASDENARGCHNDFPD